MRSLMTAFVILAISAGTVFAQVEQGNVRIGGNFVGAFFENATLMGAEGQVGYVAHPNFEFGGTIGYITNDFDDIGLGSMDVDASMRAGGYLMINFKPDTKYGPGLYVGVAKQTGDYNPTVMDFCGKLDIALGEKALLHFGVGAEWIGDVDYDIPTFGTMTLTGDTTFYIRVVIAGLMGK